MKKNNFFDIDSYLGIYYITNVDPILLKHLEHKQTEDLIEIKSKI